MGEPARLEQGVRGVGPGPVGRSALGQRDEPCGELRVGTGGGGREQREPTWGLGDDVGGPAPDRGCPVRAHHVEQRGPDHRVGRAHHRQRAPPEADDEPVPRRLAQRSQDFLEVRGPGDLVEARRLGEAGDGLDEAAGVVGERVEGLRDPGRDLLGRREAQVRDVPGRVGQLVEQREDVARVALGVAAQPLGEPRRKGPAAVGAQLLDLVGREGPEGQGGVGDTAQQVGHGRRPATGGGREQHDDGDRAVVAEQRRERAQRREVAPVGVVDDEYRGPGAEPLGDPVGRGERVGVAGPRRRPR